MAKTIGVTRKLNPLKVSGGAQKTLRKMGSIDRGIEQAISTSRKIRTSDKGLQTTRNRAVNLQMKKVDNLASKKASLMSGIMNKKGR